MKRQGKKGPQAMQVNSTLEEVIAAADGMSDKEFRIYMLQMIWSLKEDIRQQNQTMKDHFNNELHKQIQEAKDQLYREIEVIKNKQTEILEMQEAINQLKNSIENTTSRVEHLEDRTSDNEDKVFQLEKNIDSSARLLRNHEQNIQEIWDNIKRPNLRVIGIQEGTEFQTKGMSNLFNEIIRENFPDLKNETESQILEAYRTPNVQNHKRPTPRHIIMKMPNIQNKERILKATRERKQITFRGKPIRITADLSTQTLKARRSWNNIFQTLKENGFQPRIVYPAKLSFRMEDEIKTFHDKQKLKEFAARKPSLQNILGKTLQEEEMENNNENQQWEVGQ
uniref:L1 transposable element RRM domain-containing protein n=2 Tax=Marmota marmota marmota TaxID=9994 RepID=A0A8C5ZK79_MARMA